MSKFENKTILITGGTGSFGMTMVRHLLSTKVQCIKILSRDEKKQHDARLSLNDQRVEFYIGDIRDINCVDHVMRNVDFVFNAAALKQVPSCEFFPIEAVKTNVLGCENVLQSAIRNNVEAVVVLSTDKAVYPINAMGQSKALMEKIAVAAARGYGTAHDTKINVTRYGNVIGSRGSVIPMFIQAGKRNEPISVTDMEMTRFLMSLADAVTLVEHAMFEGLSGDVLVKKSPAASIETLVMAVKQMCHSKSQIKLIGTRHGEKKHESLLSAEEMSSSVDLGTYYRVPNDDRDLNYSAYFTQGNKNPNNQGYSSQLAQQLSVSELSETLKSNFEIKEYLK